MALSEAEAPFDRLTSRKEVRGEEVRGKRFEVRGKR
jgi:hypothetical protein